MTLKLSILDQTPIGEKETAEEAFQHTIELAQAAEKWGYHRFWVAEHHDSDKVVGSSPEVLVSHLLAKTSRIRIGSGGVMLQHYSPYKVAENFNVLASLAPGRVDLGIGRSPGGLPLATRALQQDNVDSEPPLSEKLQELIQFLHNRLPEGHPFYGLKTIPEPRQTADIYSLGTSVQSASLAAGFGLPYVFAQFLNGGEAALEEALSAYREKFQPGERAESKASLALSVIAADSDEEARQLAADNKVVRIHFESGKTLTLTSLEKALDFQKHAEEKVTLEIEEANIIYGSKNSLKAQLTALQKKYQVDEFVIITAIDDFQKRLHSYKLLKEALLSDKQLAAQ